MEGVDARESPSLVDVFASGFFGFAPAAKDGQRSNCYIDSDLELKLSKTVSFTFFIFRSDGTVLIKQFRLFLDTGIVEFEDTGLSHPFVPTIELKINK